MLYRGSSPRPIINYISNNNSDPYWIKIGDMPENGYIVNSIKEHISVEGAKKSRRVYKGDMILSNSMSFGKPYILNVDGYIHDGWFVIRNYESSFERDYLRYLLASPTVQKRYSQIAAGGVVLNISSDLVNSVIVKIPSLNEQKEISSFLSALDERIEIQNKIIDNLKSQIKSVSSRVYKLFSKTSKLSELISFEKKTNHKSEEGLKEGLYPFYTNEENQNKFFNSYDFDGQFILSNTGGRANFKIVNGKFAVMSDTLVIKFKNPFLARTYINFLQNNTEKISHNIFAGSGLKHLDKNAFLNINVPLIDNDLSIINKLFETLDNKLINEKKYLSLLIIQKQYLLNNLFI